MTESNYLAGQLLCHADDDHTVMYLCEHSPEVAMGILITALDTHEILSITALDTHARRWTPMKF